MELNPNHEVTKTVHDHWHKVAALIMHKLGVTSVVITEQDIASLPPDTAVGVHSGKDSMTVFLTDLTAAEELLKSEGGRPT